jgi:hypothetical protein
LWCNSINFDLITITTYTIKFRFSPAATSILLLDILKRLLVTNWERILVEKRIKKTQRERAGSILGSSGCPNPPTEPPPDDLNDDIDCQRQSHAMLSNQPMRASLQVAPLTIAKSRINSSGDASSTSENDTSLYSQSQMTPPATPNGSQEDLSPSPSPQYIPPQVFHNFLRAFYPFNPSYVMSDSSVTLPLNEGDVVLVHSIHTNGWADGTLLVSGARGWLPTNYCEAYEPDDMCNLLKALLNFWDLLRSTSVNDKEIFGNQEFMKGIIAGVRFLLVSG